MHSQFISTISEMLAHPDGPTILEKKEKHFRSIFGDHWRNVFDKSPVLADGEKILLAEEDGEVVGWVHFDKGTYSVRFRNFFVKPEARGKGVASFLMTHLIESGTACHSRLLETGEKPSDIRLMFLDSLIYPYGIGDGEEFAFGKFLKKIGFTPYIFNKNALSAEESAAIECYDRVRPGLSGTLRVFRKKIVDDGTVLKDSVKAELLRLSPDEHHLVLAGLDWKLDHYAKSGRISYRYDLCKVCAYVGSSELDSSNCRKCIIRNMCLEPFRTGGRFKEDYQISAAYFEEARKFLLAHGPLLEA